MPRRQKGEVGLKVVRFNVRACSVVLVLFLVGCRASQPLPPRAEAAAQRAIAYFEKRGPETMKATYPALDYVHRRFGVARLSPILAAWQQGTDAELETVKPMLRWFRPEAPYVESSRTALRQPIERILFDGLHCKQAFFDAAAFEKDVKALMTFEGYSVTHSAIALELARENGCVQAEALRRELVSAVEHIAANESKNQDLFFEAVTLLGYLGERAKVKPEWVELILKAQRPDGGFALAPLGTASHDHATALALWALLEAARPEAPKVNWIP